MVKFPFDTKNGPNNFTNFKRPKTPNCSRKRTSQHEDAIEDNIIEVLPEPEIKEGDANVKIVVIGADVEQLNVIH